MFVLIVAAHVIPDGTAVPGARDATQREAAATPAGRAAVTTPHRNSGYLLSTGGGREAGGDGLMLSVEEPAHALPPSAANHAMETTQCGQAFIFQPNATWESAALPWNQHKSSPRSRLLLSKKKKSFTEIENVHWSGKVTAA